MRIQVEVDGPGGVISNEIAVIREVFKALGAEVVIDSDVEEDSTAESWRDCSNMHITIIGKHRPWGG